MRAWILNSPSLIENQPLRIVDVEDPEPGQGEIRIKVKACGICHTDLHEVEGELKLPKLPLTPGHQVVGVVDKIGDGANGFKVGELAGMTWLYWACGECGFCRSRLENLCERARFTGLHADGGYAEYVIAKADFAYHLPEDYDELHLAPLLCAGVIGWRSLKLSEAKRGDRLGLFGFGASAHIVCQIAQHLGIEVYAFSRSKEHQALAKRLGAVWAGTVADSPPEKINRAIMFAPVGRMVLDALKHLCPGGVLAINAVYLDQIPEMDYNKLLFGEKTIRSVSNTTRQDAVELLDMAPKIPLKTEIEVFEFSELPRALQILKQGKIRASAVLRVG